MIYRKHMYFHIRIKLHSYDTFINQITAASLAQIFARELAAIINS
jgi:hypothetical protein